MAERNAFDARTCASQITSAQEPQNLGEEAHG
jgi:hypothetical protein